MRRKILIECSEEQKRAIIIEDEEVVELHIERENEPDHIIGNIYLGKVNTVMESLEAAFIDIGLERSAYLPFREIAPFQKPQRKLKKGEKILVQVTKGPISTKGAKCTMDISFPGRYLVYKPFDKNHVAISKHIVKKEERDRLKNAIKKNIPPGSFIIRTEANKTKKETLDREISYLHDLYTRISKTANSAKSSKLIHKEFGLVFKLIREKITKELETFVIDSFDEYQSARSFLKMLSPNYIRKIKHHNDTSPLFAKYEVDTIFDRIMRQKIFLHSGGYIIIQEAESFCAIDVNSGRGKGETFEETAFKTNKEALKEIALQLRLRNIGGIIVIDFIDMEQKKHKNALIRELHKAMKHDKAKTNILPVTALGLVEMTRQRKQESMANFLSEPCPYCKATGRIYSKETLYHKIKQKLQEIDKSNNGNNVTLTLNPQMKSFFNNQRIKRLKNGLDITLKTAFDHKTSIGRYNIKISK